MQNVLWEDPNGVRRFKDTKLQTAIDSAVYKLGGLKDKKFIIIGHTDTTGKWKVSSAFKVNDTFSIQAALYDNWRNPEGITAGGEVVLAL